MKKVNFLSKLKKEGKLMLTDPSEEITQAYLQKSENCLKSARILLQNNLYENSSGEAYYAMYNALLAVLFKAGIKSENHAASIILLKKLFKSPDDLAKVISAAKKERIDKQYYVESQQASKATKESCEDLIAKAEDFSIKIKVIIKGLKREEIGAIREEFDKR